MRDFLKLKENLKCDFPDLVTIKVAILGDTSTQFLNQALRRTGFEKGLDLLIWEADYNQIQRKIFDKASELYSFNPAVVIIFQSTHKLLNKYNKLNPVEYDTVASTEIELIKSISSCLTTRLTAKVIYYNYYEINDAVFGNYSNKTASSFLFQLRKLNYELMCFASTSPKVHICDLSSVQNNVGQANFCRTAMYITSDMALSIDVLPLVAAKTIDLINALNGKFHKCVIVDLDNTLWGGVVGDDGLENIQIGTLGIGKAFSEFQYWIKKLKSRGIIVAVCSKNFESVAKEPFLEHPDMILHLEDIAVFIANWENKVDNIRRIQSMLNIGFDSMVFIDDNPFERNLVKENIPEITVPELPEDPADYLPYLYSQGLFETSSFTSEDAERARFYRMASHRNKMQEKFTNEDDYLKSLDMISLVEPFNEFNTPRVAQLSQRSNQFNLRTVRYTEEDIRRFASSEDHFTFTFTLEDKYGSNGLIGVVVLSQENNDALFIDNWFMSCRVLKRGMENFILNTISNIAKKKGFTTLKGEYIATRKNAMVADHYSNLGFQKAGNYWEFSLVNYKPGGSFIKLKLNDKGSYSKAGKGHIF